MIGPDGGRPDAVRRGPHGLQMLRRMRLRNERAALWCLAGLALAAWAWYSVPLLLGEQTLFFRDVLHNHYSLKWVGAQALRHGEIPVFVEQLGNGLPFRGNPSALPFYPGNLLYVILPFWSAFGAHFALHWLLAGLTMFWLARTLRLSPAASLLAAVAYAGGGWVASVMTFYNLMPIAAWWPAVIAAALVGGRAGIAVGGTACGLALLGGEPLTALLGMVPVVTLATSRHGLRRGLGVSAAIGAVGTLIALPQILATGEILQYSFRSFRAPEAGEAEIYFFKWPRLLEMLIPFPFGHPGYVGPRGWWLMNRIPFYFCLYFGLVGAWLAARSLRLREARPWLLLSTLALLAAWIGGVDADLLRRFSGGLFRYTEKFLFWYAMGLPLMAGYGLDEVVRRYRAAAVAPVAPPAMPSLPPMPPTPLPSPRRRYLGTLLFALLWAAAAVVVVRAVPMVLEFLAPQGVRYEMVERALLAQSLTLALQLGVGAILLVALVAAVRSGRAMLLVLLQILSLLPVLTLLQTDSTKYYDEAPYWLRDLPPGSGFVDTTATMPPWGLAIYRLEGQERYRIERVDALTTSPPTGLPGGLRYAMQLDSEGLGQATYTFLVANIFLRQWTERARWLAILGVNDLVSVDELDQPEIKVVDAKRFAGSLLYRLRIQDPLPFAFWPDEVLPEPSPAETVRRVSKLANPRLTVLTDRPVLNHKPGGSVTVRESANDRIVLDVESDGGLLVVRRLFHPLWQARSGGKELPTTVAHLVLLGVEVPGGSHQVVLEPRRGWVPLGAGVAVLTALAGVTVAWRRRRDLHPAGAFPDAVESRVEC